MVGYTNQELDNVLLRCVECWTFHKQENLFHPILIVRMNGPYEPLKMRVALAICRGCLRSLGGHSPCVQHMFETARIEATKQGVPNHTEVLFNLFMHPWADCVCRDALTPDLRYKYIRNAIDVDGKDTQEIDMLNTLFALEADK